jgi:hypothetical protein
MFGSADRSATHPPYPAVHTAIDQKFLLKTSSQMGLGCVGMGGLLVSHSSMMGRHVSGSYDMRSPEGDRCGIGHVDPPCTSTIAFSSSSSSVVRSIKSLMTIVVIAFLLSEREFDVRFGALKSKTYKTTKIMIRSVSTWFLNKVTFLRIVISNSR